MRRLLMRSGRVLWHSLLGGALLVAGTVMLATPGPGIVTMILGLAVLAREYDWAARLQRQILTRVKDASTRARARLAARRAHRGSSSGAVTDLPRIADDTGPLPTGGGATAPGGTARDAS